MARKPAGKKGKPDFTYELKNVATPVGVSRWLGTYDAGVHSIFLSGQRLAAASIWVTGWSGGINGKPEFRDGLITRSVQLEHRSTTSTRIMVTFEVSEGPVELGVHQILFPP